jgi:hypothetical protein
LQYYWRTYDSYVRKAALQHRRGASAVAFRRHNYAVGRLSRDLALRLQAATMTASVIGYASTATKQGFVASNYDAKSDESLNSHSQFRVFDAAGQALLGEALAQMRDEVASYLGAPRRVVAAKSWTTPTGRPPVDMYGWHGDGWVKELFKIMIYLTPMTPEAGGLEILTTGKKRRILGTGCCLRIPTCCIEACQELATSEPLSK